MQSKIVVDDNLDCDISCELFAGQTIHMKCQILFLWNIMRKKENNRIKMSPVAVWIICLRVECHLCACLLNV